jgi:hypothetical protein
MKNEDLAYPVRSIEGRAALDIFYIDFNDVNFYVEDEDQENLYFEIFKKYFPEVRFSKIFPLGGKKAVLAHAADQNNKKVSPKSIYLVDKDFDDILEEIVSDDRVFYLEKYCIENYIFDSDAAVSVVVETHPKKKFFEVNEDLRIEDFRINAMQSLAPLFLQFYCVQELGLGIVNCDSKPEEFSLQSFTWILDEGKVNSYEDKVRRVCEKLRKADELAELIEEMSPLFLNPAKFDQVVSGKFSLAMMFHYIKSKYKMGSISFDSFVYRLAKNNDIKSISPVMYKIKNYLSS